MARSATEHVDELHAQLRSRMEQHFGVVKQLAFGGQAPGERRILLRHRDELQEAIALLHRRYLAALTVRERS